MTLKRDSTIDILKGIGIILVVIGHSGCPLLLGNIISSFHMPLFLIASGYFFKDTYLDNKRQFLKNKLRGVYLPYIKWSLIFLLLHNLFYLGGIINSSYGSVTGVAHLYSIKEILIKALKIVFLMSGHEGYLLGAYWFMRALFVGSVLFCFCSGLFQNILSSKQKSIAFVAGFFCIIAGFLSYHQIHPSFFPAGFYRECMAVFFIGCGYFIKKAEAYLSKLPVVFLSLIIFVVLIVIHPTALGENSNLFDWLIIPFTGVAGFILTYYLSKTITKNHYLSSVLCYIGKNTLYILTFHFLMFKPAALLYAYYYGLDWHVIGCHPVAYQVPDNWFWIIYTLTSLFFSLALMQILKKIKTA